MQAKKKEHPKEKKSLHPRNKHRQRYDFPMLIKSCPELSVFVRLNEFKDDSIDFADPQAVMMLNKALLKHYYNIKYWQIPSGYLCPPIPGRADYIHYLADLLAASNKGIIPMGNQIKCLDIGVGANCIYPIIGNTEYGWHFTGSDVDPEAIKAATAIVEKNVSLQGKVELRLQKNASDIFKGILQPDDYFDVTICNPPFHSSLEEAQAGTLRKLSNLNHKKVSKPTLNFGGKSNELWCAGGEERFIQKMILESKNFAISCFWFTSLVAKSDHLKTIYAALEKVQAVEVKTITMAQGNKISRFVAWTFLDRKQQLKWVKGRWSIQAIV
ncbi:23S rRNA (adenine(1618)-N(6))-methyltransferase RlmF [Chryseotalea sanaruensis]|uniref:Ribosomal RNA large subunit methyltransferase F n=1 Tax=Chryseotalea sanaruensis TaxID=2482724 RepID=A0A401U974_9BACT|nr:23S rRNA (adenine(1618)-N(6))-methyltransferase RlmF [Chryseotalea sanaruensis]GCC51441.1 23S rRNA (adenine(1618)-N(6))-methyltransferase RlmF [Chryseotalea sanaruensis]